MASVQDKMLNKELSRRKLLGTGAGAGLLAAAYTGGALPGSLGKIVAAQDGGTEFHSAWPYLDLASGGHFNNFVTNGIMNPPNIIGDLLFAPFAFQYWADWSWEKLLGADWGFASLATEGTPEATPGTDPDTFWLTIAEGVNWSDGTPVTTADAVATFELLWLLSNTVWTYISDVIAVDDYTLHFPLATPSSVVERYVVRRSILPASVYGEFAGRAAELRASGATRDSAEFTQLLDEFNQFRPETLVVNGPFTVDIPSITNAQFTLPKNETSFWAENVAFDRIVNFNGETDTISALVLSGEIDYATHGFPVATELQFGEIGLRVGRPPTYSGAAVFFNFGKFPELLDKNVRQALAQAIDRGQSGFVSLGESGVPTAYVAGISDNLVGTWVNNPETLNTYPYDPAAAEAKLIEAGWSKDGTWKKPDGTEAAYSLSWPAEFADWGAAGANLVEQLNAFGLVVTGQPVTFTQHPIDVDQGNFDLAIRGWGSSSNTHPRFSYEQNFLVHNTLAINNGGEGSQFPLQITSDIAGEVDLEALIRDSALGFDEEVQKAQVTTIAQVFNEQLNIIPLWERFGNNAINENDRVNAWPADDDPIWKNSFYADGIVTILMYTGRLTPKV